MTTAPPRATRRLDRHVAGRCTELIDRRVGGGGLASTADIEVGGGTIFADEQVVVTQPSEGEFKAFTTTCTHQGCQVESVSDGSINCPCHGSSFSIEDGSAAGRAGQLAARRGRRSPSTGDSIVLA